MSTLEPRELPRLFLQAMNAGDVDAVVSLYEAQGVIAIDGNQVVAGHAAIRSMVSGFLAQRPRFTLHESDAVQVGDVALIRSRWTVAVADSAGKQIEMHVGPTLVVRRHADGRWLVAIDRPSPGLPGDRRSQFCRRWIFEAPAPSSSALGSRQATGLQWKREGTRS